MSKFCKQVLDLYRERLERTDVADLASEIGAKLERLGVPDKEVDEVKKMIIDTYANLDHLVKEKGFRKVLDEIGRKILEKVEKYRGAAQ